MDEESGSSKRRRGLAHITQNACSECRKKRAKCDGERPCSRCQNSGATCLYEIPVRLSKEALRNELQQLHTYRQQSEIVLRSLTAEDNSADVVRRLRSGEALESIAIRLTTGNMQMDGQLDIRPTYQSFDPFRAVFGQAAPSTMDSSGQSTNISSIIPSRYGSSEGSTSHALGDEMKYEWEGSHESPETSSVSQTRPSINWSSENAGSPQVNASIQWPIIGRWGPQPPESAPGDSQRNRGQEFLFGPDSLTEPGSHQPFNMGSWTNITDDTDLMNHLLALYFCWEYPTFASISREHFLQDYRSGSQRFCSSLLVNSLLAVGARFTNVIEVRGEAMDGSTAGDAFFAEALRLFNLDKSCTLPTVQALGLMSIREASCGRDSESWFYSGQSIRMACEMGLHKVGPHHMDGTETELEKVETATFWGAFSLNIAWSMITGRLPHLSNGIAFMGKPSVDVQIESNEWVPYTDDGMPLERNCNQPSNVRTIYKYFCELAEILHHCLYLLYSPGNKFTAGHLVGIYTALLSWYGSLPEALRLGKNFTPSVLFVHFRSFIKIRLIGSTISPTDICIQAADNIASLGRSYNQLYTLRRTPSFVPYIAFSSALTYLIAYIPNASIASNESTSNAKFRQGILDLRKMAPCHGFARKAIHILHFLAKKWEIDELNYIWTAEDAETKQDADILFSSSSMNYFCPDIIPYCKGLGDLFSDYPIFSVFAMQGSPLVEEGERLKDAGFVILRQGSGNERG